MIILKANKVPDHVAIVSNMIANLQVINHPQRVCVSVLCCDIRLYRYCRFFSRPYQLTVVLMLQCCVRASVSDVCIVTKRCVLEQKLLLTTYRKSYMWNRLIPKWMTP